MPFVMWDEGALPKGMKGKSDMFFAQVQPVRRDHVADEREKRLVFELSDAVGSLYPQCNS
jgi:hypothetical protein